MTQPSDESRRYGVVMTSADGLVTNLTNDLEHAEAQLVAEALQGFFADGEGRSDGWQVVQIRDGFTASRESVAVTFTVSTAPEDRRDRPGS